jgi:hypothetical protein
METFINHLQFDGIISFNEKELLEKGVISKETDGEGREKFFIKEESEIYSLDIKNYLIEIIESFQMKAEEMNHLFQLSGFEIINNSKNQRNKYMDRNINIDLDSIFKSSGSRNWHHIVRGFLNLWEFQFLFSITESTLKKYCLRNQLYSNSKNKKINTRDLIKLILKNDSNIILRMQKNHNISKNLSFDIWNIFTEIRNIYAHTHGIITEKDKKAIEKYATQLRISYDDYKNTLPISSFDINNLFSQDKIQLKKFYFLSDEELSIFRNFISEFIYALSHT